MTKGLYVGSFDPITMGHLDIIRQGLLVFDTLHIGIGINPKKTPHFSEEDRIDLVWESVVEVGLDYKKISVGSYHGSMMAEARNINATAIIRGLRQISDFGDEFTINGISSRALPDVPMTYFICRQDFLHVSSSSVKEIASLDEDFSWMVTKCVSRRFEDG